MYTTKLNHARILNAYLSRFCIREMKLILEAQSNCMHRQLNDGASSQLAAQEQFYAAVAHAVGNLIEHDTMNIEKIILEESAQ